MSRCSVKRQTDHHVRDREVERPSAERKTLVGATLMSAHHEGPRKHNETTSGRSVSLASRKAGILRKGPFSAPEQISKPFFQTYSLRLIRWSMENHFFSVEGYHRFDLNYSIHRWGTYRAYDLRCETRKPVFGSSDQFRHKPACTVTEAG